MKQNWLDGELKKVFTLSAEEKIMARGMSKSYQVLFLALYKACKAERVTPNKIPKFSPNVTDFISDQLGIQHVPIGTKGPSDIRALIYSKETFFWTLLD